MNRRSNGITINLKNKIVLTSECIGIQCGLFYSSYQWTQIGLNWPNKSLFCKKNFGLQAEFYWKTFFYFVPFILQEIRYIGMIFWLILSQKCSLQRDDDASPTAIPNSVGNLLLGFSATQFRGIFEPDQHRQRETFASGDCRSKILRHSYQAQ